MPQFFIDRPFSVGSTVEIGGGDAHHMLTVLRLKAGDWLVVSDGKGRSYRSEIVSTGAKSVSIEVKEELKRRAASHHLSLAFAVIKHDRSEWIVQKAVELGVTHIIPFYSERTVPKYANADKKHGRWLQIALEAAKQSGLPFVPEISFPLGFTDLLKRLKEYDSSLLFWEGETQDDLRSQVSGLGSQVLLIIGPEGGFSSAEVEMARSAGALTASLGEQILRVETAAIASVAVTQYALGNLALCRK